MRTSEAWPKTGYPAPWTELRSVGARSAIMTDPVSGSGSAPEREICGVKRNRDGTVVGAKRPAGVAVAGGGERDGDGDLAVRGVTVTVHLAVSPLTSAASVTEPEREEATAKKMGDCTPPTCTERLH